MSPENFTYYKKYMKPCYQALADEENITFINNSYAGAKDYCRWLGLNSNRIKVIRNGVKLTEKRIINDQIRDYKKVFNIHQNKIVIGSIFRFWEEKDPILFLRTAKIVLKNNRNVKFLIIGDGPLRN